MSLAAPRAVLRVTFAVRLLLYVATPVLLLYAGVSSTMTALIISGGVILTWAVDLLVGGTIWLAAHRGTIAVSVIYLVLIIVSMVITDSLRVGSVITMLLLLLALSSDAITNFTRWKILLPAGIVAGVLIFAALQPGPDQAWAIAYLLIPFLASMARLVFPRTKHLMHTSLDYPPVRLEILSLGMKRVAAVGIRRNNLPLPDEQTSRIS